MSAPNYNFISNPKFPFYLMLMLTSVLVLYHFIAICFCSRRLQGNSTSTYAGDHVASSHMIVNTPVARLISNNIPAHKYHKAGISCNLVGKDGVCAVCLGEFEEGEELRTLPECLHSFHVSCIDMWLFSHPNCPICRADPFPH